MNNNFQFNRPINPGHPASQNSPPVFMGGDVQSYIAQVNAWVLGFPQEQRQRAQQIAQRAIDFAQRRVNNPGHPMFQSGQGMGGILQRLRQLLPSLPPEAQTQLQDVITQLQGDNMGDPSTPPGQPPTPTIPPVPAPDVGQPGFNMGQADAFVPNPNTAPPQQGIQPYGVYPTEGGTVAPNFFPYAMQASAGMPPQMAMPPAPPFGVTEQGMIGMPPIPASPQMIEQGMMQAPSGPQQMQINEPVIGMGQYSGQPLFQAGEAGNERLIFQPGQNTGQQPQRRPTQRPPGNSPPIQRIQPVPYPPIPFAEGGVADITPNYGRLVPGREVYSTGVTNFSNIPAAVGGQAAPTTPPTGGGTTTPPPTTSGGTVPGTTAPSGGYYTGQTAAPGSGIGNFPGTEGPYSPAPYDPNMINITNAMGANNQNPTGPSTINYSNGIYQYQISPSIPVGNYSTYLLPTTQMYIDIANGFTNDSPVYYQAADGTWHRMTVDEMNYVAGTYGNTSSRTTFGTGAPQ